MAVDFDALRQRKAAAKDRFNTIKQEANSSEFDNKKDERFWQPEVDKAGNGYAVIRFLDSPEGEDNPWVRVWSHGFQGPGGWYIENSLTTLGQPDPVSELNSKLWATGTEANKEIVRKRKRKLAYISNILVVSDPKHPENEGKVFLFRYGKKIFDKVKDLMSPPPEFQDEVPVDPFNFWEGANFKLKIRNVEGYRNYDKSEFEKPSEIGTDEFIQEVWSKCYSLQEFLDPKHFKTYEALKTKLAKVLNGDSNISKKAGDAKVGDDNAEGEGDEPIDYTPKDKSPRPVKGGAAAKVEETAKAEGEDEDLEYFRNLAKDGEGDPF